MAKRKKAGRKAVAKRAAKKAASAAKTRGAAKQVATKKAATKRAAAKKAPPKKAAAKRSAARKAAGKKAAAKKPIAKKLAARKPGARKKSANLAPKAARAAALREKASRRTSAGNIERETTRHSEPTSDRPSIPSSLTVNQSRKARTRREELNQRVKAHPETGPAMTAGDVDADWEQAYSSGDEAPGGDNPTPDQDVVDEIGHALGVEYQDGEELKGADKISDRDRHRWELDPASAEDYPEHEA
jgi:Family of unknown function (DUF6335)